MFFKDWHCFLGVIERAKKTGFKLAKLIPSVRDKIDRELQIVQNNFEKEAGDKTKHLEYVKTLPKSGLSSAEIMKKVKENLELGL